MSEGRAEEEFLKRMQKAREYWERASFYLKNYENDRIKSEEKASEDLWGVVSCLMNAISVIELGKPQPRHGNQREFAMQFLISEFEDGKELFKIYEKAEKLHTNFYHAFLEKDELEELWADVLRLVKRLDNAFREKLKRLQVGRE